ncbi:hypothetical protein ABZP36_034741 [Zizania latifolia]
MAPSDQGTKPSISRTDAPPPATKEPAVKTTTKLSIWDSTASSPGNLKPIMATAVSRCDSLLLASHACCSQEQPPPPESEKTAARSRGRKAMKHAHDVSSQDELVLVVSLDSITKIGQQLNCMDARF